MVLDIAIIGTGGIGGYYGARLAHAGHRVHFLLNSEYEYVKQHGLIVDSHYGDFSLEKPLVYNNINDMPACDLVCVAVKATANPQIFPQLAPILKPETDILLLQNGFGNEQRLEKLYPKQHIFGGLCFICTFREGPGRIRHAFYGKITLAAYKADDVERLHQLALVFREAGIETIEIPDLMLARWKKLVWNMPYNGLTVVMNCQTDLLVKEQSMLDLTRAMMEEVLAAAKACGVTIADKFVDEMIQSTIDMVPYDPSMRLDYLAKRPMEIDIIYGNVIEYAKEHGYDMKYAKMLKWQLECLQSQY